MSKKFLVTGASGFIGSHVADFLTSKGHEVLLFDKRFSKFKKKKSKNDPWRHEQFKKS